MPNQFSMSVPKVKPIDMDEIYNSQMNRAKTQMMMEDMVDKRNTRNAMRSMLAGSNSTDPEALMQAGRQLMAINPDEGIKLINAASSLATHKQQASASALNQGVNKMKLAATLLDGVTDQRSLDMALQHWTAATGEAPPAELRTYNPAVIEQYKGFIRSKSEQELDKLRVDEMKSRMADRETDNARAAERFQWDKDTRGHEAKSPYANVKVTNDIMGTPTGAVGIDKRTGQLVSIPLGGSAPTGGGQTPMPQVPDPSMTQVSGTPVQISPQESYGADDFDRRVPVISGGGLAKGGRMGNALRAKVKSCGGRADGGYSTQDLYPGFRTGDPLYDGTNTIHNANGETTTPELLAAGYKNDPEAVRRDWGGYEGTYYGDKKTSSSDGFETQQTGDGTGEAAFDLTGSKDLSQANSGGNALNMTVVGEKGPEVVLLPQGSEGYVLPITDKHASDLLSWGTPGRADGGDAGGGDHDHDSDGGDGGDGGDSGSDGGDGGDSDSDGGFNGGDRGMDAGSLGGEDRGGTGGDMDGSDYGGHGFEVGGSRGSGGRGSSTAAARGILGSKFRAAYDPARFGMSPSAAEATESMSPEDRASYIANSSALDEGPSDLQVDNTPPSRAKSMFSNALAKQVADNVDIGQAIDQGLAAYGLPTSVDNKQLQTDMKDWSRYNITDFTGSTPANKIDNGYFSSFVNNNALAKTALGIADDMAAEGYDMSGFGITSLNNGTHKPGSKHYTGDAVDVNSKINSKSYGEFSSRMAAAGYSRGDNLGFGKGETMHWQ